MSPLYRMPQAVHDDLWDFLTAERDKVVRKRSLSGRERGEQIDRFNTILEWLYEPVRTEDL